MSINITARRNPKGELTGYMVDITYTPPGTVTSHRFRKVPQGITTKAAAQSWANETLAALMAAGAGGLTRKEAVAVPTLAEFWPRYMENFVRANRQKHSTAVTKQSIYRHHLGPVLGEKLLDGIGAEDVQSVKTKLAHHSAKMLNNVLGTLSSVLRVAVEWKVIQTVPVKVRGVKVQSPEMEFYEPEELERLLVAARKVDERAEIVVLLGAHAGLRSGEIIALEWGDIDFKANAIVVQRSEWRGVTASPKGGKSRRIPMTERLAAALREHRTVTLLTFSGRVLLRKAQTGTRGNLATVGPRQMRSWLASAAKLAGIVVKTKRARDGGKLHILRHTFGSSLVRNGVDLATVKELMGHKDVKTTMIYAHLAKGSKEAAIRKLEDADYLEQGRIKLKAGAR